MKVFNTFFKILNKNKFVVILYMAIFMVILVFATGNGDQTQVTSFKAERLPVAVIDRDQSVTSASLREYLGEIHNLIDLKDNEEVFQDELYYRNVSNIFIIPQNFEQDLVAGKDVSIQGIEIPDSMFGIYVNMQINQIMRTLKVYLASGTSPDMAMKKTKDIINLDTLVTIQAKEDTLNSVPKYNYYYQYLPYILVAIMISVIGLILLSFNQTDVRKRTICSALSLKKRNVQLFIASMIVAFFIWIVVQIIPIILYQDALFEGTTYIYYLINSFVFMLLSVSIGYLTGVISTKQEHISIFSTSVSLALCFLGGVFVPLSIMNDQVIAISRFIPTYWYVTNNTLLGKALILSKSNQSDFWFGIMIQLCFTVVILGIALIITKKKNEKA